MSTKQSQETIRRQIISDVRVRALVESLLNMPERIKAAKNAQTAFDFRVASDNSVKLAQEELDVVEGEIRFEIAQALDPSADPAKPKKLHTNEEQRTIAFKIKCSKSDDWKRAVEAVNAATQANLREKMELGKCHNNLSALYEEARTLHTIGYLIGGLSREDDAQGHFNIITRQAGVLSNIGEAINNLNRVEVSDNV